MKRATQKMIKRLIKEYETTIKIMDHNAKVADEFAERAYGGVVRATKGHLQEYITHHLIETAWIDELQQDKSRIKINSEKIAIPIQASYIEKLPDYMKNYIQI